MNIYTVLIKISLISLFAWTGSHASAEQIQSVPQNPSATRLPVLPLGKPISAQQFKSFTHSFHRAAQQIDNDFCVGMIDDNEQAKSYGVLSYRHDQNRYLIDQIIFDGPMKDYSVEIEHQRFDRHTTLQQLKKIKADIKRNDDNDVVEDQVESKNYPVTQTLILRYFDSDDLNYFYFNNNKLISIQHVVQC